MFTEYLFPLMSSITPVTIMPVKIHSQRLPIRFLFASIVFIPLKFICYYPVLSSLSIYSACGGTLSVLATVENSSPSVVVLVKYPSLECDRTVFYKLFLSWCLGDAHPVSVQ